MAFDKWKKVPRLNQGGIPDLNDPHNRDTVPAMLTPGEFVLNKEASQMFRPHIEAMNNAGLQQRHAENQMVARNMGGPLMLNPGGRAIPVGTRVVAAPGIFGLGKSYAVWDGENWISEKYGKPVPNYYTDDMFEAFDRGEFEMATPEQAAAAGVTIPGQDPAVDTTVSTPNQVGIQKGPRGGNFVYEDGKWWQVLPDGQGGYKHKIPVADESVNEWLNNEYLNQGEDRFFDATPYTKGQLTPPQLAAAMKQDKDILMKDYEDRMKGVERTGPGLREGQLPLSVRRALEDKYGIDPYKVKDKAGMDVSAGMHGDRGVPAIAPAPPTGQHPLHSLLRSKIFQNADNDRKMQILLMKHQDGQISTQELENLVAAHGLADEYNAMTQGPESFREGEQRGDRQKWQTEQQIAHDTQKAVDAQNALINATSGVAAVDPMDDMMGSEATHSYVPTPASGGPNASGDPSEEGVLPMDPPPPPVVEDPYAGIDDSWFVKDGKDGYVTDADGNRVWAGQHTFMDVGQTNADIMAGTKLYNPLTGQRWIYGDEDSVFTFGS